jgi:hypothetical protein
MRCRAAQSGSASPPRSLSPGDRPRGKRVFPGNFDTHDRPAPDFSRKRAAQQLLHGFPSSHHRRRRRRVLSGILLQRQQFCSLPRRRIRSRNPASHISAGEKVCIQMIKPMHLAEAFASSHSFAIAYGVVSTDLSTSGREWVLCARVPQFLWSVPPAFAASAHHRRVGSRL